MRDALDGVCVFLDLSFTDQNLLSWIYGATGTGHVAALARQSAPHRLSAGVRRELESATGARLRHANVTRIGPTSTPRSRKRASLAGPADPGRIPGTRPEARTAGSPSDRAFEAPDCADEDLDRYEQRELGEVLAQPQTKLEFSRRAQAPGRRGSRGRPPPRPRGPAVAPSGAPRRTRPPSGVGAPGCAAARNRR